MESARRPARLSGGFVRSVKEPGRYGDGRGGFGLSLLVKPTSSGRLSKTWSQRVRLSGEPFNVGLGSYPRVTLEEARLLAIENARAADAGVNPVADRRRRMSIPTFREAAETVIELHSPNWKEGSRTARIWHARLEEYAYPLIGHVKVDALTVADVLSVLTPIWATRRETARKLRQYVHATMAWTIAQGIRSDNPAGEAISAVLQKGGVKTTHQRALAFAEVPDALSRIRASNSSEVTKLAIEFLTHTACRSAEVRGATWAEVDTENGTWTIPGSRMKTGRAHRVPLSPTATALLQRAREYADSSGLVFPSATGRMLSDNTLSKVFRDLGIAGTPHGMRSSFRDWAAECSDAPREVAELALAHIEGSAAELAYRRTDYFERRRSLMEAWSQAVLSTNSTS